MFDLGILDGRIYLEGQWIEGSLYIKDGKVMEISSSYLKASEEYNAAGRWILPGFIDPHVHFSLNVGKYTSADDFYSGSVSAAFGGVTTFIDFLDPVYKSEEIEKAYEKRRMLSKNSVIDYGFHATLCKPDDEPYKMISAMNRFGIPSAKFFTAYSSSNRNTTDDYLDRMMKISAETSTLMLIHSENEDLFSMSAGIPVCDHEKSRPAISEISEVIKLAEMSRYRDAFLYIVHVSCGTTVKSLKAGYGDVLGRRLFVESCPHYFAFNTEKYQADRGELFTMTPPIRSEKERTELINHIDNINVIGTDHCPFLSKEKKRDFTAEIPMGIGGIEQSFAVMFSMFREKIIDKFTTNPAKIHGLYPGKGTLLPGSDADIVVFDPQKEWTVSGHHSKCDYSVYEGMNMNGRVESTISKGCFVVKDGQLIGGNGQYLERNGIRR